MQKSKINKPFTRSRVSKKFTKPSRAKQSFKNECDINGIMKKWEKNGVITHINEHKPAYGAFPDAHTYQDSMNAVIAAQDAFMELPATMRAHFENDPAKFLNFVENPDNAESLIELGLATPKEIHKSHTDFKGGERPQTAGEPPLESPSAEGKNSKEA